ncbi:DUF1116 domain-containing protein [Candidatus Hecatella orcuttiae]|jgi:hypothetical protein|uniref:DUF1116 domain-containing protein n=1 Tax=Candidatus Hecatella orcuttiae TaxID=1935119 RepID=UPI0028683A56|nr:DUF1116 domain-containing protein [Candidatus Hecatella orcuttiae]
MSKTVDEMIDEANARVIEKIVNAETVLVDINKAVKVIPGMKEDMLLHAGPPIEWKRMCGPMKGAALGALVYEGLARDVEEAARLVEQGRIRFSTTHEHDAVAPMAGIISPSMPVFVVKNKTFGNTAFSNLNEGVGQVKTLRFGANNTEVVERLRWMEKALMPALKAAIKALGEINLKRMIAEALRRGDECHNRNKSATAIFFKTITPPLVRSNIERETLARVLDFIGGNDHFFLNLSMASSKATMDPAQGINYSTVVTAITTNGVELGIRVSGLGNRWFTAPAPVQSSGKIFQGFRLEDANPVVGDSYISEPAGIGGFAMAASPAIAEFVGGSPSFGVQSTKQMYRITVAKHRDYRIPYLDYEGTPLGIDIRKVLRTGITPVINTGLAHRSPGIGQVGAGIVYPPLECFEKAVAEARRRWGLPDTWPCNR